MRFHPFRLLPLLFAAFLAVPAAAQAISAADAEHLAGDWELVSRQNAEGLDLPIPDGPRDVFSFSGQRNMSLTRKGETFEGQYKFSPASGELVMADGHGNSAAKYIVREVNAQRLVLFYPDELEGSKTLVFAPKRP